MSSSAHIFLSAGRSAPEAARELAAAIHAQLTENGFVVVADDGAELGGEVLRNVYGAPPDPEPDELSALDGYDIAWEIRRAPADDEARRAEALRLLDRIVDEARWPALLVENLSALIAARQPGVPRFDFPPGTSPDIDDREVWQSHAWRA